jgi:predicted transcriptional regulator
VLRRGGWTFIHLLGKDTRRYIIAILLENRSYRELADMLGVTPAAIVKYVSGKTHPSDRVIERAVMRASREEKEAIAAAIADEVVHGLKSLVNWMLEEGIIDKGLVRGLEDAAARLRLASVGRRSILTVE